MRLVIDDKMAKKIIEGIQKQLDEFAEDKDKHRTVVAAYFTEVVSSRSIFGGGGDRKEPWCLMLGVERPTRTVHGPDITDKYRDSRSESYGIEEKGE